MLNTENFIISEQNFDITDLHKNLTHGDALITRETLNSDIAVGDENSFKDVKFQAIGSGNKIMIGDRNLLDDCGIFIEGNNNSISIGSDCQLRGTYLICIGDNNTIKIGNQTSVYGEFWGKVHLHTMESTTISLGNDCLLSGNIVVRTTDGHAIINKDGQRVNKPKNIKIGNHVWIGMNVMVLKGSSIPDNSIVGANSVVTKVFQSADMTTMYIAGNPAKIIKQNKDYWVRQKGFDFKPSDYKLDKEKK